MSSGAIKSLQWITKEYSDLPFVAEGNGIMIMKIGPSNGNNSYHYMQAKDGNTDKGTFAGISIGGASYSYPVTLHKGYTYSEKYYSNVVSVGMEVMYF